MLPAKDINIKLDTCQKCLCRTCINLSNPAVMCGNTEFYCKSRCGGEFASIQECKSYKLRRKVASA